MNKSQQILNKKCANFVFRKPKGYEGDVWIVPAWLANKNVPQQFTLSMMKFHSDRLWAKLLINEFLKEIDETDPEQISKHILKLLESRKAS